MINFFLQIHNYGDRIALLSSRCSTVVVHFIGNEEVAGSILANGTTNCILDSSFSLQHRMIQHAPVSENELRDALTQAFPNSEISVHDTAGDSQHYSVDVISAEFNGLSRIQQHRLLHQKIEPLIPRIHALQIKTSGT